MDEEKIVVVGGYVGCGKTSWICQQIALKEKAFPKYYKKMLNLWSKFHQDNLFCSGIYIFENIFSCNDQN